MFSFDLNDKWMICDTHMEVDKNQFHNVLKISEGWMQADLPADVRMPLLENGRIKEPLVAEDWKDSMWVADKAWWFVKRFSGKDIDFSEDIIQLEMSGLDARADIFLNDVYIGTHKSVHYPFVYEVKDILNKDENVLLVRMTAGLEEVSMGDLSEINYGVCIEQDNGGKDRSDKRRAFLRKPQYVVGWDWGPTVISCGITGGVKLVGHKEIALREMHVYTDSICGNDAIVKVELNIESLGYINTKRGDVSIDISFENQEICSIVKKDVLLTAGYNYIEEKITIKDAKLWWPNGYGEQPLYQVNASVTSNGVTENGPETNLGIRSVTVDTATISGKESKFALIVNGCEIFCKGGNWIPNDFIYARVPRLKYHALLDYAVEAGFNMIRVWGGGLYEKDIFYNLCDEKGILLWHDFMFACSCLPDHRKEYCELVRNEYEYQTKRLRNHCCIGLFSGSNEIHWLFNPIECPEREVEYKYEHQYGLTLLNMMSKEIIRKNCSHIYYWNSSPFGGDSPNCSDAGDIHYWRDPGFMSDDMDKRIDIRDYDRIRAKFVTEYGYVGPTCKETMYKYLGEDYPKNDNGEPDRTSYRWWWHSNVFEHSTVNAGIEKNYAVEADKLSLDDYILYGGLVHSLMYGYSLESFRFKEHCYGGLIWMYNDAWGEVGWTIVDYYLNKKIPFYGVKRAFRQRKFIIRHNESTGEVMVMGCNDCNEALDTTVKIGYVSFDGKVKNLKSVDIHIDERSRKYVYCEKLPAEDYTKGTIMLYCDNQDIDNAWLRMDSIRNLDVSIGNGDVNIIKSEDGRSVTVTSDKFVHAIILDEEENPVDNYFDILPGETKSIELKNLI